MLKEVIHVQPAVVRDLSDEEVPLPVGAECRRAATPARVARRGVRRPARAHVEEVAPLAAPPRVARARPGGRVAPPVELAVVRGGAAPAPAGE